MGHSPSDLDPEFGNPSPSDKIFAEVPEDKVREVARTLFEGFDLGANLQTISAGLAVEAAVALDALIKKRISEAQATVSDTDSER